MNMEFSPKPFMLKRKLDKKVEEANVAQASCEYVLEKIKSGAPLSSYDKMLLKSFLNNHITALNEIQKILEECPDLIRTNVTYYGQLVPMYDWMISAMQGHTIVEAYLK